MIGSGVGWGGGVDWNLSKIWASNLKSCAISSYYMYSRGTTSSYILGLWLGFPFEHLKTKIKESKNQGK